MREEALSSRKISARCERTVLSLMPSSRAISYRLGVQLLRSVGNPALEQDGDSLAARRRVRLLHNAAYERSARLFESCQRQSPTAICQLTVVHLHSPHFTRLEPGVEVIKKTLVVESHLFGTDAVC